MHQKNDKKDLKQLTLALTLLKDNKEIKDFLSDLLSVSEIKDLAKRINIACLLQKRKLNYKEIAEKLKTSTTTVTRVAHWLKHGNGVFDNIISKINQEFDK